MVSQCNLEITRIELQENLQQTMVNMVDAINVSWDHPFMSQSTYVLGCEIDARKVWNNLPVIILMAGFERFHELFPDFDLSGISKEDYEQFLDHIMNPVGFTWFKEAMSMGLKSLHPDFSK